MFITVKDDSHMYCGNDKVHVYKTTTNDSDDRLKENEVIIESVCETLSELRPQLYDKKPDINNDVPTTWYKESGLTAQEIYYDAIWFIGGSQNLMKKAIPYHYLKYRHQ